MPRAVRFEDYLLTSPEELASPHHTHKDLIPKGILLQAGSFEQKTPKSSRRISWGAEKLSRRHSTPVKIVRQMQNLALDGLEFRNDGYRSRRRSMPIVDPQHSPWLAFPLDSLKEIHAGNLARPPLTPFNQKPILKIETEMADRYRSILQSGDRDGKYSPYHGADTTGYLKTVSEGGNGYNVHGISNNPPSQTPSQSLNKQKQRVATLKDVVVHRHLAQPRILWNIGFPFSSAVFNTRPKMGLADLDLPATVPALDKMTVKFDHSRIQDASAMLSSNWGSIKIRGSFPVEHRGQIVCITTFRDVINAIFDYFQVPLTRGEFESLSPASAALVLGAQRKRLGSNVYQMSGNPLRVDVLGDLARFDGVQITAVKERRLVFGLQLGPW